ncbi:MAG: GTPase ObgE [Candidatus Sumerlaeia bacterium]|nr:GTPase ObgE [Candidatus Sumerlaeia bacterium]
MKQIEQGAFVDYVKINVEAGDGGQGCIAFLRDKLTAFGGPAGGDGGRGGSIFLEGQRELTTLLDFKGRPFWRARRGAHGEGKNCSGQAGEDIVLPAPLGTVVTDADTGEVVGEVLETGQRLLIAKGGDGGRGNQHFANATNKAPRKAEAGWPGDKRTLILELKVIADAGLIGLPNAGKSTLLAALTRATPKIAAYPFTTLTPNLGVFLASDLQRQITLADIPGLIEGAHDGLGLGHRFLRHIERTKVLVHLVAPEAGEGEDGQWVLNDCRPDTLLYAWKLIEAELAEYSPDLPKRPRLAVLSKIDLMSGEERDEVLAAFRAELGVELLPISAQTGEGLDALRLAVEREALALDAPAGPDPQPEKAE